MTKLEKKKELLKKIEEMNNNGKKTIAIFTDAFFPVIDGVVSVVDNYAKRLKKYFNVVVCAPRHKISHNEREYLVIEMGSIFFNKLGYDYAVPEMDAQFKQIIKKLRIDLVHLHSPFNAGFFAVKLAKKRKIPVVGTFHSLYKQDFLKQTNSMAITKMLLRTIMRVYNNCDEVWTMNTFSGGELVDYGYKGKINYFQNSSNFVLNPDEDGAVELVNEKYGLKGQQNVLLFLGRLVSQKNILFIADCLQVLKQNNVPFKMIYVGKGPDEEELIQKIKTLGLEKDVIFTGLVTDKFEIQGWFSRADLFVFPSVYDTEGVVKIEAALCKTPTIAIAGTGAASGIEDNVSGFLSEENVEVFSQRIMDLLNNKAELARVGLVAKQALYKSWDEIVASVANRYEELIEQKKSK